MTIKISDDNFPSHTTLNLLPCMSSDRYLKKVEEVLVISRCCVDPNNTNIVIIDFSINGVYLYMPTLYILSVGGDISYEDDGVTAPFIPSHYASSSVPVNTNCAVYHGQLAFDFGNAIPDFLKEAEISFKLVMAGSLPQSYGIESPDLSVSQIYNWSKGITPRPINLSWYNGNLQVVFEYEPTRDCSCNIQCSLPTGVSQEIILCPDKRQEVVISNIELNGNPQNLIIQLKDSVGNLSELIVQGLLGVTPQTPSISKFMDPKRVEISINRQDVLGNNLTNVEYQLLRYEGSSNNYRIFKDWSFSDWDYFVDYDVIPGKTYGYSVRYKGKFQDTSNFSDWAEVTI